MAKRLINLRIEHIAGVDRPANKRKFLIVKSEKTEVKEGVTMLTKEELVKITDTAIQEAVIKQMEEMSALQKQVEDKDAEIAKMKEKPPDPSAEEFWKGTPPHIRNAFERLQSENETTKKTADKERDEREEMLWTQKGEAHKYLQVTPVQYGRVMKTVSQACPSEAKEIEKILTLADEAISKGSLWSEIGKSGLNGGNHDATDIVARVEALADEFMKRDKDLGKDVAIQQVFKEHKDWYQPYRMATQVNVR